ELRKPGWLVPDGRSPGEYGRRPGGDPMTYTIRRRGAISVFSLFAGIFFLAVALSLAGCGETKADPKAEAPPPAKVEPDLDASNFKVDRPDLFPLVTAVEHKAAPALNVTGVVQPEREQILYEKGAIAKSTLEQAEDTAQDAKVDLDTAAEQLRLLGVDKEHPSGIVDVTAPISGVITDQQVTNAAGVQGLSGPNPFTISDLSYVWIICDVYEN